ncbi:MAG: T9SS type A sorting domain-containing protein [Bacteroidales bacterium]|nr:T9SS type A sorting domain-containing protein [Bacteroidales bacterium]
MKHKDPHKLKSTALLVFCILLSLPTFSQHFDWAKSYSGYSRSDYPYNHIVGSVTDSHGNLYVAGQFGKGATIDGQDLLPFTPYGSQCNTTLNAAIVKFSPDGQIMWKKVLHANQGFPCTIDEIHLVGDTALYVESLVDIIPTGNDAYLYFYDTLITSDDTSFMIAADSLGSGVATAFSIMDLDGNFLEHHFLQIAWIDSNGAVITMDRSGGINPESTSRIDNQAFPGGPFGVDSDGNIYIGQVPTDIIALLDGWYSIENGKLSGVLIMVDGHSRFTFYPENRPSVSNYRILKFSPHFDNLIQYQYVFADTPFWDDDVPTAGRLLMDSDNNIYLCQTVYNDIRRGSGRVSLNGASDMAFEGKEATMGFIIKYNSHLEPQYIRQIDYQNTSNNGYYNYYFHDMAIDEDSNSVFVIATVANDVPTDSMYVDGVQLDANNNALFLRFDKNTGRYLSHGIVPTNKYSNFYGTIHNTDVVCKNNRVFALPTFQNNIQWQNNEINIEQYKWGKGLFIWDYAGNPIQYIDFNSISIQSEPGTALALHDSVLYICGYSRSSMTVADTTLNPSGNTLAYILKYVDTSFMTPYVYTGPRDTGDVRIKVVEDGNAFVAYPNPFRQRVNIGIENGDLRIENGVAKAWLTDMQGRREEVRLTPAGNGKYTLDLTSRPQATYLLTLTTATGKTHTFRLLKQSDIFSR